MSLLAMRSKCKWLVFNTPHLGEPSLPHVCESARYLLICPRKLDEGLLQHPLPLVVDSQVRTTFSLLGLIPGMCEHTGLLHRLLSPYLSLAEARMKQFVSSGISSVIKACVDLICVLLPVHC